MGIHIDKTISLIKDELTDYIGQEVDFAQITPEDPIHVKLKDPQYMDLLYEFGRRFPRLLQKIIATAAQRYWAQYDAAEKTDDAVKQKQEVIKANANKRTEDYFAAYQNIASTYELTDKVLPSMPLSSIHAGYTNKIVRFQCDVLGYGRELLTIDAFRTSKGGKVFIESYNLKAHGEVREKIYVDTQTLLVEEHGLTEHDPRKVSLKIFEKEHVAKHDIGDRLDITALYSIEGDTPEGPASDPDEERKYFFAAINVTKLDSDEELKISKETLAFFRQELKDNTPEEFLKKLTKSFVPHITGNHVPKLLCLLVSVGAIDMGDYRRHLHGYLVGNPGTGKSDLIRGAAKLRHKAIYADGPNASSRGLLYGLDNFGDQKILKAGLLVKHELVCLDEIDKMDRGDRLDIATTLEQQRASYHKANFDKDSDTNVSLLAAGNPKNGRWDNGKTTMDNLSPIQPELLSRMMIVKVDKTADTEKRVRHILGNIQNKEAMDVPYDEAALRALISYTRKKEPKILKTAEEEIIKFLVSFDSIEQDADSNLPIEARQQIEIIRLSTAFAKLLLKPSVDAECAKLGVEFFKSCMKTLGIRTEDGPVQLSLQTLNMRKEDCFTRLVNEISRKNEDSTFSEENILSAMTAEVFWATKESARMYWEKMLKVEKFYEPTAGRYRWA